MNLCSDCKYFYERMPNDSRPMCIHPENLKRDPVTGGWVPDRPVRSFRKEQYACGPDGLLFELDDALKPKPGFDWSGLARGLTKLAIIRWILR